MNHFLHQDEHLQYAAAAHGTPNTRLYFSASTHKMRHKCVEQGVILTGTHTHTTRCATLRLCPAAMKALAALTQGPVRIGSASLGPGELPVAAHQVVLHVVAPSGRVTTDGALVRLFPRVPSDVTL